MFNPAACAGSNGGTNLVFTSPMRGALAITARAHAPTRDRDCESGKSLEYCSPIVALHYMPVARGASCCRGLNCWVLWHFRSFGKLRGESGARRFYPRDRLVPYTSVPGQELPGKAGGILRRAVCSHLVQTIERGRYRWQHSQSLLLQDRDMHPLGA